MRNLHLRSLILAALFAALTAWAAQIRFFLPGIPNVPVTLQVLAVCLAGGLLGPVYGTVSLTIYLLLGAVGLPVFAGFKSGLGVLVGPTGGYLWSYPAAAAVVGLLAPLAQRPSVLRTGLAMLAGLGVIYLGGAGWAIAIGGNGFMKVLTAWVLPFVPLDLVKVAVAASVSVAVNRALIAQGYQQKFDNAG